MTQIDRAGAIFSKLEEQNSKAEVGLAHMEEQRSRLQAEVGVYSVVRMMNNDNNTMHNPIESQICTYIQLIKGSQG